MSLFLIKLILSVVVGGTYAALMTWISERFGSKVGGLLLGLPSTSIIGLIFIAWTQNPSAAVTATSIAPASIAAASLFTGAFVLLYRRFGVVLSFLLALCIWGILTLPFVITHPPNITPPLIIAFLYLTTSILIVRKFSDQKIKNMPLTAQLVLARAITSGTIIGLAVVLSNLLGPLWGGLMSGFPALFASSTIILLRAHGIGFASSVAKRMPYGNITSTVFVVGFYFLVPSYGMVIGTALAYGLSILTAVIIYFVVFPYQRNRF